jgi:DNA-binding FadR family transcriptional regulator
MISFPQIEIPENLHSRVTRVLALQILEAERDSRALVFPNEAELCHQLGVSRTILREAVKVLADKGMVEARQKLGTRAKPRTAWNQLDPDILGWWAELGPDTHFLRDLCEVRLAIEPTASGFAAVRATTDEIEAIGGCLKLREAQVKASNYGEAVDLSLEFHSAVAAACHNSLLEQLSRAISRPLRIALSYTTGLHASDVLDIVAHRQLYEAICNHDSMRARAAAERIVGIAMLGVEEVILLEERGKQGKAGRVAMQAPLEPVLVNKGR